MVTVQVYGTKTRAFNTLGDRPVTCGRLGQGVTKITLVVLATIVLLAAEL